MHHQEIGRATCTAEKVVEDATGSTMRHFDTLKDAYPKMSDATLAVLAASAQRESSMTMLSAALFDIASAIETHARAVEAVSLSIDQLDFSSE